MDTAERIISELESILAQADAALKQQLESTEQRNQFLRMLRACYDKALKDADTRIPSYLHAALENVMALIPGAPTPAKVHPVFGTTLSAMCQSSSEIDSLAAINAYVEAGIRRDQRERNDGRADHDCDATGRTLKAGK